jgi:O-methyltransferase involved in polyketide biosynthesis
MYLPEQDGAALFRRITDKFPGGQIAFDGYSGSMVRGAKVDLVWGVDDPHDLEQQVPRLHLVESVEFLTMPELVSRLSTNWFRGAMYRGPGRLPFYRHLVRRLRYEFAGKPAA